MTMIDVSCFCGGCYSFNGDVGACPNCGEIVSLTHAMDDEDQSVREALLGNLGTEVARHRTQVTVGQLEPGLGERIG